MDKIQPQNIIPSAEELLSLQLSGYSSKQIFESSEEQLNKWISQTEDKRVKAIQILQKQTEAGIITLSYYNPQYPKHFKENLGFDAPVLIHLLGDKELIHNNNCITIIGARKADAEGLNVAYQLAFQCASEGHPIVSGLALGCDTAAHRGCLDAGGKAIAIVASGLDITHPKSNKALQEEIIAKGGLILSEHPFGVKANPTRLVARCRMQVVLSQKIIVAQCPTVSGTMYAVRFAKKYKGDLYAVESDAYREINSGNLYLLEHGIAAPIRLDS